MVDTSSGHELVASFFTLTGAGFGEEPRHSFAERSRAAAAAGFTGIGLQVTEIEFLGGWCPTETRTCRKFSTRAAPTHDLTTA